MLLGMLRATALHHVKVAVCIPWQRPWVLYAKGISSDVDAKKKAKFVVSIFWTFAKLAWWWFGFSFLF